MNKNIQAKAGMLIRRPVAEVFEAFLDPEITTKFWFTKSTGRLEVGNQVTWEWGMYGVSSKVYARAIDQNRRILIEWDGCSGRETVEWAFKDFGSDATFVSIASSGFRGNDDEVVKEALDSMGGFTSLLAGLKAYLEHGIQLNLVADAHPEGL